MICSSQLHAGLVTFNFVGGPTQFGDPLTYSSGGIDLNVYGTPGVAVDTWLGIGVISSRWDNWQVDGHGPNERVHMFFSHAVDLVSVGFKRVGWDDEASIWTVTKYVSGEIPGAWHFDWGSGVADTTERGLVDSNYYGLGVVGNDDDYYISKITVMVPEPGVLGLLGIGLLAIAFRRRYTTL